MKMAELGPRAWRIQGANFGAAIAQCIRPIVIACHADERRRRRHLIIDAAAAEKNRSARRRRRSKSPGTPPPKEWRRRRALVPYVEIRRRASYSVDVGLYLSCKDNCNGTATSSEWHPIVFLNVYCMESFLAHDHKEVTRRTEEALLWSRHEGYTEKVHTSTDELESPAADWSTWRDTCRAGLDVGLFMTESNPLVQPLTRLQKIAVLADRHICRHNSKWSVLSHLQQQSVRASDFGLRSHK